MRVIIHYFKKEPMNSSSRITIKMKANGILKRPVIGFSKRSRKRIMRACQDMIKINLVSIILKGS